MTRTTPTTTSMSGPISSYRALLKAVASTFRHDHEAIYSKGKLYIFEHCYMDYFYVFLGAKIEIRTQFEANRHLVQEDLLAEVGLVLEGLLFFNNMVAN